MAEKLSQLNTAVKHWRRLEQRLAGEEIEIKGNGLDISTVVAVSYFGCVPKLTKDPEVLKRIESSIEVLKDQLSKGYSIYGVNTGFGDSADSRTERATTLQTGLLQLTQAGVTTAIDRGEADLGTLLRAHSMPPAWVRAAIVVRCNSNANGVSGLTLPVLQSMFQLLEHRITPIVPLRGSISASGDLMPLSYIAGTIEGNPNIYVQLKDKVTSESKIMSAPDALRAVGMQSRTMGPKEALGLINGTACSAGVASVVMFESHRLALLTQALSAMGLEALMGNSESYHPFISSVRPHPGQIECAQNLLVLLSGSHLAAGILQNADRARTGLVQDRYAWRSVPQWIGPQLEDLLLADQQIATELNSACDNPLVDSVNKEIYTGANFQAASVTSAMEKTRVCLQMFGKLLFSQSTELIDPNYNNGLPINLTVDDSSVSFTMKGVDISMAAYMAELAYLANPVSSHVQTAEMHNQAINSLALISSRYTMQAVELVSLMCSCSLYISCQALDLRALHLAFLKELPSSLHVLNSRIFSSYVAEPEIQRLNSVIDRHVSKVWLARSRLSIPARCEVTMKETLVVLLDSFAEAESFNRPSLADFDAWKTQAIAISKRIYQNNFDKFSRRQHTAELLGEGSRILYKTVREKLGVPFHLGLVEHPTEQNPTIDGRPKKTIGSWISIIYEALREGRLLGPLMELLEKHSQEKTDSHVREKAKL
ncbi:phenylalanine ammonia-lyase [Talaromyces proteolyticus]|uniref:Phenylalanine ammonia-lyase n=1 Tax=Talaromyces proteolyticus TaxID=1131652 RepID=A0AAD4L0Y4_9EURO|nr:phenylalanine ammonia-lyase [Talaromyces proteolyticus]KAH8704219.1 phenylalanine ammonia-lyase [Talaromyces proteolyticus]